MDSRIKYIHMVGIGGAGMSGIAEILLNQGYNISGSDMNESAVVEHLRKLGAKISIGHKKENLGIVDVLVKSTAISENNPEVIEARKRNIPIIPRAEMLAELMRLKKGIAIAGTHGKTTTTSLIASIFDFAGLDPTVIIGGRLNAYGTNAHMGNSAYLIAEADESDGSFLCLLPIINIVTNIDEDHLDYYGNRNAIDDAFVQFMNNVPFYGLNIVCGDDCGVKNLLSRIKRPILTYGFEGHNILRAKILEEGSVSVFEVYDRDILLGKVSLPQPGRHNILNALGAIAAAMAANIEFPKCAQGLEQFKGVARRFEYKGEKDGIILIDDYGHHPVEIEATLKTAKKIFPDKRLVVAFQPHRFSRTQDHFGEFCKVFECVDLLLLTEIYAASEKPIPGVSGQSLAQGIKQVSTTNVQYFENIETMEKSLSEFLKQGDVLLTLGAGSITKIGNNWLGKN